jgi:hypothetical protein
MSRAYSKRTRKSSRRTARLVEKTDVLCGHVAVSMSEELSTIGYQHLKHTNPNPVDAQSGPNAHK